MEDQLTALDAVTMLGTVALMREMHTPRLIAATTCLNVASAMCQVRDGAHGAATSLIYSTLLDTEKNLNEATAVRDSLSRDERLRNTLAAMGGDLNEAYKDMEACIEAMGAIRVALAAWLDHAESEHKALIDPARHPFTATCETHVHDEFEGLCCCCRQMADVHMSAGV